MRFSIKKLRSLLPATALSLLLTIGTPAVAFAHGGANLAASSEVTNSKKSDDAEASNRTKAEATVKELRQTKKAARTTEQRTKVCESRKQGLQTKYASLATNADRYLTRVNEAFAKAQIYQNSLAIPPNNVELIAAAEAAKKAATDSVAELSADQFKTINCASETVATDVATFKTAAAHARDDLKAYKQSVKAILQSLKTVEPKTEDGN